MSAGVQRSRGEDEDDPSLPVEVIRTVTPGYGGRPDREMDVIGWLIALGMVILLLPLIPALIALWLLSKLFRVISRGRGSES